MSTFTQALSNVISESFNGIGWVQVVALVLATLYCVYVYYLIASKNTPQVNVATWNALVFLVFSMLLHMYVVINAVLVEVAMCSLIGIIFQFLAIVVWSYPTVMSDPERNPTSRLRRWARRSKFKDEH